MLIADHYFRPGSIIDARVHEWHSDGSMRHFIQLHITVQHPDKVVVHTIDCPSMEVAREHLNTIQKHNQLQTVPVS